jgi:hypothetical protein
LEFGFASFGKVAEHIFKAAFVFTPNLENVWKMLKVGSFGAV